MLGNRQLSACRTVRTLTLASVLVREPALHAERHGRAKLALPHARDRLYTTALDPDQAAVQLGLPPADVAALIDTRHLLAIDGPDGARLPTWQIEPA